MKEKVYTVPKKRRKTKSKGNGGLSVSQPCDLCVEDKREKTSTDKKNKKNSKHLITMQERVSFAYAEIFRQRENLITEL